MGGTRGMCLIEKRSQSMLCSLELNRGLSRQVMGVVFEKYFPLSPLLTRMHNKAFCQQGQEE